MERISEFGNMSKETSLTNIQKKKIEWGGGLGGKEQNIQQLWNNHKRCNICKMVRLEEEKGAEELLHHDDRHQTTDPGIPIRINTKKSTPGYIILRLQKIKDKGKTYKEAGVG